MKLKLLKKDFEWLDGEIVKLRDISNTESDFEEEIDFSEYLKDSDFESWFDSLQKNIYDIYKQSKDTRDADIFKDKILLNPDYSWAIASHGKLGKKIKNAPAQILFLKVDTVITAYEKGNRNLDDLVTQGKISNIMGEATVTEWLHRFYPNFCPMKNKRNHFLFSNIPSLTMKVFKLNISEFASYSKIIGDYIGEKFNIKNHSLVLAERLAWLYSIDSDNEEAFSEFADPRFEKEI